MLKFMELPFEKNALEPYVSEKTIEFHYGKHHKAYVDKVNELIIGTEFENLSLEDIIKKTHNDDKNIVLYNNAGQVYNHNVYWNSFGIGKRFDEKIKDKIAENFESIEILKQKLVEESIKLFGSGWVWLVKNEDGNLEILSTKNGDTPLVLGYEPIFTIDVWEHAYYLDYQNLRKSYAEALVNHLLKL